LCDLKILASHPTQYHALFFKELVTEGLDIDVGYYHQGSAGRKSYDEEFGINIAWDIDLLTGYTHHIFCKGVANFGMTEQIRLAPQIIYWSLQNTLTPLLLMGWFTELMWLIWLLRILTRGPILLMSETTPGSFVSTTKPAWRVGLLRWLLQHTNANLYIGSRNRDFLLNMGVAEERLFHTPYSIDNMRFSSEADRLSVDRQKLCEQCGLDPELPTFLYSGKLIHKKRPLQLLEAYRSAGLADKAQLLYVGEGKLRPKLERRVRELDLKHVHLLGFLNQTQMPLGYVLGEVLCLISDPTETWGLVVNEALACGIPVIVTDTAGCCPDMVDFENGWIVPLDDHNQLTKTLLLAFNQRADWIKMGELGRIKVAKNTFSAMAGGVLSAIRSSREK
jgi:glycosyltransferase involved in cell wall biosynthesis